VDLASRDCADVVSASFERLARLDLLPVCLVCDGGELAGADHRLVAGMAPTITAYLLRDGHCAEDRP